MRFQFIIILLFSFIFSISCSKKNTEEKIHEIDEELKYYSDPQLLALNDAIEDDPENPLYYYKRAKLYYEERSYSLAIKDINEAIRLDNLYDKFYFLLSKLYYATGKTMLALNAAKHAESLKSLDPELFIFISQLYWELKDISNSDVYLAKASTMAPFHTQIFLLKGKISAQRGDTAEALKSLYTALQQDKQNVESYKELIKIYESKKMYDSAWVFIVNGKTVDSKEPAFYYYEGKLLENLNYKEGAKAAYLAALKYDSSYYLANYGLGMMYYKSENLTNALPYFEATIKYAEHMIKADELIAEIYERTGREVQAIPYYQRMLAQDTSNSKAKTSLERLYKSYPEWFARLTQDTITQVTDTSRKITEVVIAKKPLSKEDSLKIIQNNQVMKKKNLLKKESEITPIQESVPAPPIQEPKTEAPAPVAPPAPTNPGATDKGSKIKFKKPKLFNKKGDKDTVK